MQNNNPNDPGEADRTVQAQRRRRSETPGPGGRERAEAPQRRRDDGGGNGPQPPVGGPGGGNVQLPGNMSPLMTIIIIAAVVILGGLGVLGGNNGSEQAPVPEVASATPRDTSDTLATRPAARATATPRVGVTPTPRPSTGAQPPKGQKWLVMLYQDADDKVLEQDIYIDLNEAERAGSTDRISIVAQLDRYKGGYKGDGNWTSARRYYVTQDDDLQQVRSQQVADLGEVNMSDPQTLVDFTTWAIQNYPADHYALILSDHGMGWPGGWTDDATGGNTVRRDRAIPLAGALGNMLYLNEIDQALAQVRAQTGVDKIDLVGLDACLMGHLEVLDMLAPHARYAVVSQETEPSLGWAYTSFLGALAQNPDMGGAELSRAIVGSYIQDDQRIVDDEARAELAGGGFFRRASAQQVTQEMERQVTITAVDLAGIPELMGRVNTLAMQLQQAPQKNVAKARNYAQSFTSVFGEQVPPSYIDLGHFVQLLKQTVGNRALNQAADDVTTALGQVVLAEKHGADKPGASGVSIYYPNSQLYANPATGAPSYTAIANRFTEESLWDDFLAFHYTGRDFDAGDKQRAVPGAGAKTRAPGAGAIRLTPIKLSGSVAAPGKPVTLRTTVSGDNVGYVFFFTGFYDRQANAIFVADQDYLESSTTREINGVYYPDWGNGDFNLAFDWEPLMYAINDGSRNAQVALLPQTYGGSPADAVYTVDGLYTSAGDGETRYARLYFRDSQLRQVFAFTGQDGTGAPREVTPQRGDTFQVQETWIDLDASGKPVGTVTQPGGTLTFGDQAFTWKELDAAAGEYVVGFIVEDLDGNSQAVYTNVTVK